VALSAFEGGGDLPPGVHRATLREVLDRFGVSTPRRRVMALRLARIYELAENSGQLARFIVFGSFVTAKPEPNDVDVFLLIADSFEVRNIIGEMRFLFEHATADAYFGASVFWLRRMAVLGGEQAAIEDWQVKRDGSRRGVVEIVPESS
jgi:AcrR family transcriptional regulator